MSKEECKWYLDKDTDLEEISPVYLKDDDRLRWNYKQKEIVRILNGYEKQLAELKAENERLKKELNIYIDETNNICKILGNDYLTIIGCRQVLQQQLKEKDDEIDRLEFRLENLNNMFAKELETKADITEQVCEKIKVDLLDQIEKGEK